MDKNISEKQQQLVKQWKRQLVIRPLLKSDSQEALDLVYKSYSTQNPVLAQLNMSKEEFYSSEGKIFQEDHIYEKSYAMVDPSSNNKILSIIIVRDMFNVRIAPPDEKLIKCPKEFLKLQMYYDLWQPLEHLEFDYNEAETTSICTDPQFANLGLTQMIQKRYILDMYLRNVQQAYNLLFSKISYNFLVKYKSLRSQVIKHMKINDYTLNGDKIFQNNKFGGVLLNCTVTQETVIEYGWDKLVKQRKQLEKLAKFKVENYKNQIKSSL